MILLIRNVVDDDVVGRPGAGKLLGVASQVMAESRISKQLGTRAG